MFVSKVKPAGGTCCAAVRVVAGWLCSLWLGRTIHWVILFPHVQAPPVFCLYHSNSQDPPVFSVWWGQRQHRFMLSPHDPVSLSPVCSVWLDHTPDRVMFSPHALHYCHIESSSETPSVLSNQSDQQVPLGAKLPPNYTSGYSGFLFNSKPNIFYIV